MINEATWKTSSSKEEKLKQLWDGIKQLKETILIQNGKLDKLTNQFNRSVIPDIYCLCHTISCRTQTTVI